MDLTLKDFSISASENSYSWAGSATILTKEEFELVPINTQLTLQIHDVNFNVIVSDKSYSAAMEAIKYNLSLISTSAYLAPPLGYGITKTWTTAKTAKAIAEELLTHYPFALDWQILDWLIAPNLFSLSGECIKDALKKLVAPIGGIVTTKPSGDILVRGKFKHPLSEWYTATPDHYFSDESDNITINEKQPSSEYYNRFRIAADTSSSSDSSSLKIEVDSRPEGYNKGGSNFKAGLPIYLYATLPRGIAINSIACSAGTIVKAPSLPDTLTVSETIVFSDSNSASLANQTSGIISYEWVGNSLGNIVLDADGKGVTSQFTGIAVLTVTYHIAVEFFILTPPALLNGSDTFQINVYVMANDVMTGNAPITSIEVFRGNGLHRGPDVQDSLLCSLPALQARGKAELDSHEKFRNVSIRGIFKGVVLDGDLIEVYDSTFGVKWRGSVSSVSHSYTDDKLNTTMEVLRL